jgi:type 1 glutamine amidotransferase
MSRLAVLLACLSSILGAQPKNILYVTHSAGYRHDCLPLSRQVLDDIGTRSGKFQVTATEDLGQLTDLARYSAVVFFTSGELPLTAAQKQGLLEFIRNGGGFAGIHSATDTLYTWPEYGDLIGGRFDGHPWTQEVRIDVEDPDNPAVRHLEPSFVITDEIYVFREFSRERVRVLMTLDNAGGDYPLAWVRNYGKGRVFYTALGHFESTWQDARFQRMVEEALAWVTGQSEADAQPRPAVQSTIAAVGNAATMLPAMTIAPGSFVSIFGTNLTTGATMASDVRIAPRRLAGTRVLMSGEPAQIAYASPGQINVLAPGGLRDGAITVEAAGSPRRTTQAALARFTPGIFVATLDNGYATLWSTGLNGAQARVTVNGVAANVTYSGPAPGWPGLDQVNVQLPPGASSPFTFELTVQ